MSGEDGAARDLLETLLDASLPCPAPHMSSERLAEQLRQWYFEVSVRVVTFVEGLAVWDGLNQAGRRQATRVLREDVPPRAVARYHELFAQLALEVPEFGLWTGQLDHQATRAQVRYALAEVRSLLRSMPTAGAPSHAASALSNTYRAMLDRPTSRAGIRAWPPSRCCCSCSPSTTRSRTRSPPAGRCRWTSRPSTSSC